ncbi:thaumatin-like protein [Quercus suber]|uniref:Thaumatin-like protein n=1 Tax=Quercus suber TaxID=58331 RepID=A0AAW0KP91_QUESU
MGPKKNKTKEGELGRKNKLSLPTELPSFSALFSVLYSLHPKPLSVSASAKDWSGIQPGAGKPILARGGFKLQPGKAYSLHLTALWSGRGL